MKRLVSLILVLVLALSTTVSVRAVAPTVPTNEDIATMLAEELSVFSSREELYDFIVLYKGVVDSSGLFDAYWDAFAALTMRSDREETIVKAGMELLIILLADISDEDIRSYIGIDAEGNEIEPNEEAFKTYLVEEVAEPLEDLMFVLGYDTSNLRKGIVKLDKLFILINNPLLEAMIEKVENLSKNIFLADVMYDSTLELDRVRTGELIRLFDEKINRLIISDVDVEIATNKVEKLVNFYNGQDSNDQKYIFDYLNKYGFIQIADIGDEDDNNGGSGNSGTNSGGGTVIILPDEDIPFSPFPIFSDLVGISWAQTPIERLFRFGVVNGRKIPKFLMNDITLNSQMYQVRELDGEPGLYIPDDSISRAEFAALIVRIMGAQAEETGLEFDDVEVADWFNKEVTAAYNNKYILGIGKKKFAPNKPITRQEIALIISRILVEKGLEGTVSGKEAIIAKYIDYDSISSWAVEGMNLAVEMGIMEGSGEEGSYVLKPLEHATRAEAAVMLYRLAKKVTTVVYINPED